MPSGNEPAPDEVGLPVEEEPPESETAASDPPFIEGASFGDVGAMLERDGPGKV